MNPIRKWSSAVGALILSMAITSVFANAQAPALFNDQTVIFWQEGFPAIDSQAPMRSTLSRALDQLHPSFWGVERLNEPGALAHTKLLILPYGSAFPHAGWPAIQAYLDGGGNLLVLGGSPFAVPVTERNNATLGKGRRSDSYAKSIGLIHSNEVRNGTSPGRFSWSQDYTFLPDLTIRAKRVFALAGAVHGMGYFVDASGDQTSAPVVAIDHTDIRGGQRLQGSRQVFLDFEPEIGYWESKDGSDLIRIMAEYAIEGATRLSLDVQYSSMRQGSQPDVDVHLWQPGSSAANYERGVVNVVLAAESGEVLQSIAVTVDGPYTQVPLHFGRIDKPGVYLLKATYSRAGKDRAIYTNGLWIDDGSLLQGGPKLEVGRDSLRRDGHAFLPVGTNYFTTEGNGWDLWGPRNVAVWERDFTQMQRDGVTLVRTGIWWGNMRIVEPFTSEAGERFLRNMQAYLLSAHHHGIAVNFTLFAFDPGTTMRYPGSTSLVEGPGTNPYLDPSAVAEQRNFVLSVVTRFKDVPWLCWDLINEPSFSNPHKIFHGNEPNRDPWELDAWHRWLRARYVSINALSEAWSINSTSLRDFDDAALPQIAEFTVQPPPSISAVQTIDYNLFAQDSFAKWVSTMVAAVRSTGSRQLINVGQDEGGVNDRVLNQFYGGAGVSFTANHTYWNNDALLWDSFAAKRPGIPNIIGETGAVRRTNVHAQWEGGDEGQYARLESKMVLGFAAGSSGALQWDWSRDSDLGMLRSDGSIKSWQAILRGVSAFASEAERHWDSYQSPDIAVVLPQSYQLSPYKSAALLAQTNSVRALFQFAHLEAYAVGEYQTSSLGTPKLIILPSPQLLSNAAWSDILDRVRRGSTLLVTGPFDRDAQFQATERSQGIGLFYSSTSLEVHSAKISWPAGSAVFNFSGDKRDFLDRANVDGGAFWAEAAVDEGRVLFTSLPIEMSDDMDAVGRIYAYAAERAGVKPVYLPEGVSTGILVSPSRLGDATLYVVQSESTSQTVAIRDIASGALLCSDLPAGRAALVLVSTSGVLLKSYNWIQDGHCGAGR